MLQIASDGGLLERPVERTEIALAPGERAELLVPVVRSGSFWLRDFGCGVERNGRSGAGRLRSGRPPRPPPDRRYGRHTAAELPSRLVTIPRLDHAAREHQELTLAGGMMAAEA